MPDELPLAARVKRMLLTTRAGRIALVAPRALMALQAARIASQAGRVLAWSVRSREIANFTYATTAESKHLLAAVVGEVTNRPAAAIIRYIDELESDRDLATHVETISRAPESRWNVDPDFHPGRRLAFYLLARAQKPGRVVEAGVDKGLGAVLISRALALNAAEGHPGDYLGIEHDATKPIPLYERYPQKIGRIVRGDSLAVLGDHRPPIDLFIHDTIPEPGHMRAQLEAALPLMSSGGVIASTWTTPALIDYALAHGLRLLTHQEETAGHWFPGDRVAFIFGFPGLPASGNNA